MPEKWRPSVGDIITIAALVVAVIMWFVQPTWEIGAPLTAATIAVVIFAAARHPSHALVRIPIAGVVIAILIAVTWHPIFDSFRKEYPRAALNWPITLNPPVTPLAPPADPPDMPPTNLPGPTLSKWESRCFSANCHRISRHKTRTRFSRKSEEILISLEMLPDCP